MIQILFIFTVFIIFSSQTPYDNSCESNEPFDSTGTVTADFNDPDGDCLSNDWVMTFTDSEGNVTFYDDEFWSESEPGSDGWYDFNSGFWDCCDDPFSGAQGGDDTESCTWEWDEEEAILTIDCP